jgi:hypothetical protein
MKKTKKNLSKKHKKTKSENKTISLIFSRYIFIAILGMFLYVFYLIFTPLTIYPLHFLLDLFYEVNLINYNEIIIDSFKIVIIPACVAGAAYFLLTLLNFSIAMNLKKRIYSLLFLYSLFWFLNILRLFLFSVLFIRMFSLFNFLHLLFWYFLSGILVFLIWILTIKIFKITAIPVIDDFKILFTDSIFNKKRLNIKNT